ncbi:MAG: hypothetical protein ACTSPB_24240 [Candidatus Thorarchaeota archaeon]
MKTHLFYFERKTNHNHGRWENSINWKDDVSAIEFTLNQRRDDGELQFRGGVAVIPRIQLDNANSLSGVEGKLSYERDELPDNPYHGNLLLTQDVPKIKMKMVAAYIALAVSEIILCSEDSGKTTTSLPQV